MTLSRRLEQVEVRYEAFRRGLPFGPASLDPFGGSEFPGKTHFRYVEDLHPEDPLRRPLLRWLFFLIDARIHVPWLSAEGELLFRDLHPVKEPMDGQFSLAQMRDFALEGTKGAPEMWWRQRARCERRLSDHRRQLFVRKEEVAERLGISDASAFWNPLPDGPSVVSLAERALGETRDAAGSLWAEGWTPFVEAALGRGASEGWPARLAPDTLRELLGEMSLFRGVNLQTGALPPRWAPMSFVRASAMVGRALCRALGPRDLPFVVARDPHRLSEDRVGELFGLWASSPAFLRKKLGLSTGQIQDSWRAIRRARLCHLRLLAARVLLREAARSKDLAERFSQITFGLLGQELPPTAALARFSVPDAAAAQFVAHLSAASWESELVQEHDEDWYRNPRAQEELRETMRVPAVSTLAADPCERGLEVSVRALCQ